MSNALTNLSACGVIADILQQYIDCAKSGTGVDMIPACHKNATDFGYLAAALCADRLTEAAAHRAGS